MTEGRWTTTTGDRITVGFGSRRGYWWLGAEPDDQRNAHLQLRDVIGAAAGINRWTGWSSISLAVHSLNVGQYVRHLGGSDLEVRTGFGHDLHETIVGDVSRPLKKWMAIESSPSPYDRLEAITAEAFAVMYGWVWPHPEIVIEADATILGIEADLLGMDTSRWNLPDVKPGFDFWVGDPGDPAPNVELALGLKDWGYSDGSVT